MNEEFKDKGYVFTTLLKYKQKYEDAKFVFTNSIPRSSVKKILGVVKLSDLGDLVKEGDDYVLEDVAIVYEDDKNQVRIAIPEIGWTNEADILKNIEKVVITNKIEMLKKVIQEAVMKKKKDSYIRDTLDANIYYSKIIYYTDEVKIKGINIKGSWFNMSIIPDKGFFYIYDFVYNVNANGSVYTDDKDVLNSAAKYIIELNGIKVNNLKELIQMFMKFKDKFYITEETLANFKDNNVVSIGETCEAPLYLDGIVIYTNDFKTKIGCGLELKKGVIAFSYEWVAASPDVWAALLSLIP